MALGGTRRGFLAAGALALTPLHSLAAAGPTAFRNLAASRNLLWGAAVEPESMERDAAFAALVRRHCAVLTPENAMKWDALRPTRDRFDFDRSDRVVALARAQGAAVHGHCLVWHEAMPAWLAPALNPRSAEAILTEHIRRVVGRYAGKVRSWDVVNEVVERNDRRPDGLRLSPWFRALGPDYIELAFRLAHEADPAARLAFADYGLEYDNVSWMVEKRGTTLALLRGLKRRGVPIHALAIQGHLEADQPAGFGAGLKRFLAEVAGLGLDIYVTELDVNDQKLAGDRAARDQAVADLYRRFLEAVLSEPAVKMVNTWGLSDRYTSKTSMFPRADGEAVRPLPFDRDFFPKPAALAIQDVLGRAVKRA